MRTDLERRIVKMINPPSQDECLVAFQVGQYGVFARFAHGLVTEFNIKKKDYVINKFVNNPQGK